MSIRAKLILIHGLPGTGKSTLATKLANDLNLPLMTKDVLKEFFFDELGVAGREESRLLGRASSRMLYILAEEYLAADKSIMIESAFFTEFARADFGAILEKYPANVTEIYCQTDATVRRQRFQARFDSGERHQGHQDGTDMALLKPEDPEPLDTYAPLAIGRLIKVDTTNFTDTEYRQLLSEILHG